MDNVQLPQNFYDKDEEIDFVRTHCLKMLERASAYKENCSPMELVSSVKKNSPYSFTHISPKDIEEECESCYLDYFREPDTSYFDFVR